MPAKAKINLLYWFFHYLINIYMYTFCRLKIVGRGNVPRRGGLIVASNHIAGADPFLLGSAVPRECWFMAKKELFEPFFLGGLISRVNAFPVNRFGLDLEVIKKSIELLKQNRALIMFPEGTRSADGILMEGKIGVGMLASKAVVPIIPVYLKNTKKAWFNLFTGKRMLVIYGEPISGDWIRSCPGTKEGYRMVTDKLMEKLTELQNIASKS